MDRLGTSEPGGLNGTVWRRYCPRCAAPTSARLAHIRGPYERLVRRVLHRQRLECATCGLRLRGLADLDSRTLRRQSKRTTPFLSPVDGRTSTRLLHDLKRAELDCELGLPVRPIHPLRRDRSVDD
jgi:ribosomal protein L34E